MMTLWRLNRELKEPHIIEIWQQVAKTVSGQKPFYQAKYYPLPFEKWQENR